jgi:hypothetical protein
MTTHLNLLAGHPTLLQRLSISTNFLDVPMLSAIGNLGALGQLRHLELATGGTKLTAEGLRGMTRKEVQMSSHRLRLYLSILYGVFEPREKTNTCLTQVSDHQNMEAFPAYTETIPALSKRVR